MSFPGGIQYTNSGFLLSSKTLIGKQVTFTRLAVGDGELGGQSPLELTTLIHEVESIEINKLQLVDGTSAIVGGPFTNQGLAAGFWWREVGLYALDPDTSAEKLYCYGNAGALADYIPSGGGAEIIEKQLNYWIMASAAANISAVINSSLIYASAQDLNNHVGDGAAHGATAVANALTMMLRDAAGRSQVADPVGDLDAANQRFVNALVTAEAILAKLLTVDVNDTGLNATTINGVTLDRIVYGTGASATTLIEAIDVNTLAKSGFFYTSLCTNTPTSHGHLLHIQTPGANLAGQLYIDAMSNTLYYRRNYGGTWDPWVKLWGGNELRINNGMLEFNNGGTWTLVGTKLVRPSANIKHSLVASEKTATYGTTTNGRLLAKFIPTFSGAMRILATVKGVSASCYLAVGAREDLNYLAPTELFASFDTPIGTFLGNPPSVTTPITIAAGTGYTSLQADVVTKEGEPLFFTLYAAASGGTAHLNSLSLAYDDLTSNYISV